MAHLNYINNYLTQSIEVKNALLANTAVLENISAVASLMIKAYQNGNKVLLAGNGGSAADAQHIAAELVCRFFLNRRGLPAIALTTDSSVLTAIGNDFGFDQLFSRQVEALGQAGDIFIGISTSGNSENVLKAVECAKEAGLTCVIFCGESGQLKELADVAICVPSKVTPYIQECHINIGHMLCAIVEQQLFAKDPS